MKIAFASFVLAAGSLLAASAAHAQVTFRVGPHVGVNRSFGRFAYPDTPYLTVANAAVSGLEAGVVAQVGLSDHWAVQPAVLYAQKGFGFVENADDAQVNFSYRGEYTYRFDYLSVPVNVLYSTQPASRGLQVFAGPYVGALLGGRYTGAIESRFGNNPSRSDSDEGAVEAGDTYNTRPGEGYVSRAVDAGLQGGLGFGFAGGLQVQVSYSQGLRNLGAAYAPGLRREAPPTYRNHVFQFAAAYLLGSKN